MKEYVVSVVIEEFEGHGGRIIGHQDIHMGDSETYARQIFEDVCNRTCRRGCECHTQ